MKKKRKMNWKLQAAHLQGVADGNRLAFEQVRDANEELKAAHNQEIATLQIQISALKAKATSEKEKYDMLVDFKDRAYDDLNIELAETKRDLEWLMTQYKNQSVHAKTQTDVYRVSHEAALKAVHDHFQHQETRRPQRRQPGPNIQTQIAAHAISKTAADIGTTPVELVRPGAFNDVLAHAQAAVALEKMNMKTLEEIRAQRVRAQTAMRKTADGWTLIETEEQS